MLRIQTFYPRGQPEARVATVPFSIEVSGACGLQDLLKLNMTYIKRYFLHKQDLLSFLFLYLQHFPSILFHFSVAVLWIRIPMDPELLPGSGSGIKVSDPDPAKRERA